MRGLKGLLLAGIAVLAFSSCPAFGDIVNGDFSSPALDGSAGWLGFASPEGQPLLSLVEVVDGRLHMRTSNTWNWDANSSVWVLQEADYSAVAVVQDVPADGGGFYAPAGTTAIEFDADVTISNNPAGNSAAGVQFDVNYNGSYAGPGGLLGNGVQTVRVEMPGLVPNLPVMDFSIATFSMLDVSPPQPDGGESSFTIMVDAYLDNFKFVPVENGLLTVPIDIKPGARRNRIDLSDTDPVRVAIFSTETFDALQVDPLTVRFADAAVRLRRNGQPRFTTRDVNEDGLFDMMLSFETQDLNLAPDATEALLTGMTYDGLAFQGIDFVKIVHGLSLSELSAAPVAVPEPSSIMLLILGGMSVLRRRRLLCKDGN